MKYLIHIVEKENYFKAEMESVSYRLNNPVLRIIGDYSLIWKQGCEEESNFVPALETNFTDAEWEDLSSCIKCMKLKILPDYAAGSEGRTYKLRIENGFNVTELVFWGSLPRDYPEIKKFFETVYLLSEKYSRR